MRTSSKISGPKKKNSRVSVSQTPAFFRPSAHAGLTITQPGDVHEQEADHIAGNIMHMPANKFSVPNVQRKSGSEEEEKKIQRKEKNDSAASSSRELDKYANGIETKGDYLSPQLRSFFEPRFGYDFSGVKVHTDSSAVKSAQSIDALAYTKENNIVFNHGQFSPQSETGKKLLAHELSHVIQQNSGKIAGQVQRAPIHASDKIHQPIIDDYRTGHRFEEGEGPSDAAIKYRYSTPVDVLNHASHSSAFYLDAVHSWPDDQPIWPRLISRQARIEFVRFILSFDETNCVKSVPWDPNTGEKCSATASAVTAFANACQGFASQMYARYTNKERLPAADVSALGSDAKVNVGSVAAKFQIPIKIATVPGHAFNAVLIDTPPEDANSWLFFEPQNDQIFLASDPRMTDPADIYASSGIFTLSRLTKYDKAYHQTDERSFMLGNSGTFKNEILGLGRRMFFDTLFRNIFAADDAAAYPYYTSKNNPPQTYEEFIARTVANASLDDLVTAFKYLNGRTFRRAPGGPTQRITRAIFLQLMNRPGLETLIP